MVYGTVIKEFGGHLFVSFTSQCLKSTMCEEFLVRVRACFLKIPDIHFLSFPSMDRGLRCCQLDLFTRVFGEKMVKGLRTYLGDDDYKCVIGSSL